MDEHTLKVLEFDKIKNKLRGLCQSSLGQEQIDGIVPASDLPAIQNRLNQVQEMKEVFLYQGGLPSLAVNDVREILERIKPEGTSMEPEELLQLAQMLLCVKEILKFSKEIKGKYPLILELTSRLRFPEPVLVSIQKAIEPNGEMKDSASPELKRIRREKIDLRQEVGAKLHSILRSAKVRPEEEIITLRQGRYVISLPESELNKVKGIIQDRSGTGLTYFLEPLEVVEWNNKLRGLDLEERHEIHRILLDLTSQVRQYLAELQTDLDVIGILDSLAAKARLAIQLNCHSPLLNEEGWLNLQEARHPFLDPEKVVPLSIKLGRDFSTLIITGPNTGGKTVALKTVGLLSLMAQAGLQIPTQADSKVGLFKKVFADIGDEQSIEMSLSTFSSHIGQIIRAVEQADNNSLVLLDEIGAGTDPKEGAALGEAILLYLTEQKVRTIATTHLGALKVLAQNNPAIENGSFEFDARTLKPTYVFRLGLPGSSYAVEIASRLGLNPSIVSRASELIGTQEKDLTSLLAQLEEELRQVSQEKKSLSAKTGEVERLLALYTEKIQRMEKEQKEVKSKALAQAKELVSKAKLEIEHLIRELRESQAEKQVIKKAFTFIQEQTKEIEQAQAELKPSRLIPLERIEIGKTVWVDSLQAQGEVLSRPDKSGKLKVQVGGVTITTSQENLFKSDTEQKPRKGQSTYLQKTEAVAPEISIRGLTIDEAIEKVDKYLDQALLGGLSQVSIIHGKGTGTLRRKITQFLKTHPRVEETFLAEWNQGGTGVTVVKLKK